MQTLGDKVGAAIQNNVQEEAKEKAVPLLGGGSMISISYLAGTIDRTDQFTFKKMIYRATRGKALTYF